MPELAAAKGGVFAAKSEQRLHVRENSLLIPRAARSRERVVRITNPSTWKIAPVIRIAAARHSDIVAVINLRNAPQREREPECQLQLGGRAAFGAREKRHIVSCKKKNQKIRVYVQCIVPQHMRKSCRGGNPQQDSPEGVKKR